MQFLKTLFVAASVVGLTVASPTPNEDPAPLKYEKAGKLATTSEKLRGENVTIGGSKWLRTLSWACADVLTLLTSQIVRLILQEGQD